MDPKGLLTGPPTDEQVCKRLEVTCKIVTEIRNAAGIEPRQSGDGGTPVELFLIELAKWEDEMIRLV